MRNIPDQEPLCVLFWCESLCNQCLQLLVPWLVEKLALGVREQMLYGDASCYPLKEAFCAMTPMNVTREDDFIEKSNFLKKDGD